MVLALKVRKEDAQKVKKKLESKSNFRKDYEVRKDENFVYLPIKEEIKLRNCEIVNKRLKKSEKLGKRDKIKSIIPSSYDIVGEIAILEVDEENKRGEKEIAKAILEYNKNIKTVVKKASEHEGEFRIQKTKFLAGKRTKETIHKESGCRIKLNIDDTYFSVRSSNERLRVSKQVKKGEKVLVMFSGIAPFGLVISKNSDVGEILCVEKNPKAHKYALENVKLNKIKNLECLKGDVRKILGKEKFKSKFDRVIMPLPRTAEEFLELAIKVTRKGGIIHLYAFSEKDNIKKYSNQVKKSYKNISILRTVECGSFSPAKSRICLDLKVR